MIAPAGQSTARAGLRSKLAALVVRRQAGPATKGLHAPWIPKVEVAEGAGYANAVLLFALNARALCSVSKFGSSLEPPVVFNGCDNLGRQPAKGSPSGELAELARPEGSRRALRHRPPTAKGRAAALPAPLVRNPFTAVRRGRACPARDFAMPPVNGLNPSGLLRGHLP